jgi:hypothetical protein
VSRSRFEPSIYRIRALIATAAPSCARNRGKSSRENEYDDDDDDDDLEVDPFLFSARSIL